MVIDTGELTNEDVFLFQIGSIKRMRNEYIPGKIYVFLFQIGSIKSESSRSLATAYNTFLFQIGSIKSECWLINDHDA